MKKSHQFKFLQFFIFLMVAFLLGSFYLNWEIHNSKQSSDFPVDMIIPYVDASDQTWLSKKAFWQKQFNTLPQNAIDIARFRQNDELKYVLRSVEKNLPWIHKIFIITDHQIPNWLDTNNPKIQIVFHQDIFPESALPVFNSAAIEARLPYVPNLSEHFLFANDDTFISVPLPKSYFFDHQGNPKVYVRFKKRTYDTNLWLSQIKKAHELVAMHYPLQFAITPSHNIQPYRKSYFLETIREYQNEFDETTYSKFRRSEDINRIIVDLSDRMKKRNTFISENNTSDLPAGCHWPFLLVAKNFDDLIDLEPCLFCLNDFEGKTQTEIDKTISILKYLWPQKSSFEK